MSCSGLISKDSSGTNQTVSEKLTSKEEVTCKVVTNSLVINEQLVVSDTVHSGELIVNNELSTPLAITQTEFLVGATSSCTNPLLPHNSRYVANPYPNWNVVNFKMTVPAIPIAEYPSGTPLTPYTVPVGRMALLNTIYLETSSIMCTITDMNGKRYFITCEHFFGFAMLDQGDTLELWNQTALAATGITSLLEFDRISKDSPGIDGNYYEIIRGDIIDFPVLYTVPQGFMARFAPFRLAPAFSSAQGRSSKQLMMLGSASSSLRNMRIEIDGILLLESIFPVTTSFVVRIFDPPVSILSEGSTLGFSIVSGFADSCSVYTTLLLSSDNN